VSQYPPEQSDTYVKATTYDYWPYFATDPTKSLIGSWADNSWLSTSGVGGGNTNQRFHIDLGSEKVITRLYYENLHGTGAFTDQGVKSFTFWSSNTEASFLELDYSIDEGWTQMDTEQPYFDEHIAENVPDPKYILVTNSTACRYYGLKFADNYGGSVFMGLRRIELQTGEEEEEKKEPDYYPLFKKKSWGCGKA
ncbi:unnamed protein product, partial [marine sediment metagenome]